MWKTYDDKPPWKHVSKIIYFFLFDILVFKNNKNIY